MNVDFVPFIRGVRVLCKPRLIFSRINGPNVFAVGVIISNLLFFIGLKAFWKLEAGSNPLNDFWNAKCRKRENRQ